MGYPYLASSLLDPLKNIEIQPSHGANFSTF